MNRRAFLASLSAVSAGMVLDLEWSEGEPWPIAGHHVKSIEAIYVHEN